MENRLGSLGRSGRDGGKSTENGKAKRENGNASRRDIHGG
jgi:hypothetical protein